MKFVILGVGAAGIAAARELREQAPEAEIEMISQDTHVHSRCMLHKYISAERDEAGLNFTPADFFTAQNIAWKSGAAIVAVEPQAKLVKLADGTAVSYDKLLIATGADSVIPPIGALRTAPNVHGLRHLTDAQAIRAQAALARRVVIIGSGLVGLDAAYALLEMGKDVTVVEMAGQILPLNLDGRAAAAYQQLFTAHGCKFLLNAKAADTQVDAAGKITAVLLADGTALPCELVVVAAGVRPAISFLEGSGIACERGICVDGAMRTSQPDIYAAGDVTALSGIWPNAAKQGIVAARNICGQPTAYSDTFAAKNTINFYGLPSLSLGRLSPEAGDTVEIRDDCTGYKKALLHDGRIVGLVLQGEIGNSGFWQYLIKNGVEVGHLAKSVWQISYADFFGLDKQGEYLWVM